MSEIRRLHFRFTGLTPLLMHKDNIEWSDEMTDWAKANKKTSTPGDDRSPAHRWLGSLYHDGVHIAMPAECLQAAFMKGATETVLKGNTTFKSRAVSGMAVAEAFVPVLVNGKPILYSAVYPRLKSEKEFRVHVSTVEALGFSLFVKRARIGTSKHVRVRARFDSWTLDVGLDVWDEQITDEIARTILSDAGRLAGLGDWRPSSPKSPGPFGRFSVEKL